MNNANIDTAEPVRHLVCIQHRLIGIKNFDSGEE